MKEFTIVTNVFDIGRGQDANKALSRTFDRYLEEFAYWARIRNQVIVYTDSKLAPSVLKVRERFGLADKTTIIEIDNLFELEPKLLERMTKASQNQEFRDWRYFPNAFSNNPKYDYLWMMKSYFINDAYERGLLNENVAWVDFGFDHGGTNYADPTDFDFLWEYEPLQKIQLFCLSDPDKLLGIESLQMMDDCVMANMWCMPRELAPELWKLIRNAMEALLMLNCVDDDQQLLLMAYKARPDLFETHISSWSLPMKEMGAAHLKVKEKPVVQKKEGKPWVKQVKNVIRPLLWWKTDERREFAKRCFKRAERIFG